MNKINTSIKWILGILGVIYLFNLYRQWKEDPTDIDVSPILDKIKEGEEKLKDIENSDPEVEDILDKWNTK